MVKRFFLLTGLSCLIAVIFAPGRAVVHAQEEICNIHTEIDLYNSSSSLVGGWNVDSGWVDSDPASGGTTIDGLSAPDIVTCASTDGEFWSGRMGDYFCNANGIFDSGGGYFIRDYNWEWWDDDDNDHTGSVTDQELDCDAFTQTLNSVYFYQDADFGGSSFSDTGNSSYVGDTYNDSISSLIVTPGLTVVLYSDSDLSGDSLTLVGDDDEYYADLRDYSGPGGDGTWNDVVSSYRIF